MLVLAAGALFFQYSRSPRPAPVAPPAPAPPPPKEVALGKKRTLQELLLAEGFAKGQDGRDAVYETLDLWAGWWRDVLLVREGCTDQIANADREDTLAAAAEHYHSGDVARFLSAVVATRDYLERNVNPRLALETLVLSMPRTA